MHSPRDPARNAFGEDAAAAERAAGEPALSPPGVHGSSRRVGPASSSQRRACIRFAESGRPPPEQRRGRWAWAHRAGPRSRASPVCALSRAGST